MTKREHYPDGYDPLIDRRLPPALPCLPIAVGFVVLIIVIGSTAAAAILLTPRDQSPMSSPTLATLFAPDVLPLQAITLTPAPLSLTASPTPDAWSATGTALALATASSTPTPSSTLDYCYWLTPSPTPSPTIVFPADAAGATALAQWLATHPPTTPTAAPLRELCLSVPTWTPQVQSTSPVTFVPVRRSTITAPAPFGTPAITLPVISPPPTWTPQPSPVVVYRDVVREVVVTSPPLVITVPPVERIIERIVEVLVEVPVEVIVTVEVPVEVPIYMTVVVTATPTPSEIAP